VNFFKLKLSDSDTLKITNAEGYQKEKYVANNYRPQSGHHCQMPKQILTPDLADPTIKLNIED